MYLVLITAELDRELSRKEGAHILGRVRGVTPGAGANVLAVQVLGRRLTG